MPFRARALPARILARRQAVVQGQAISSIVNSSLIVNTSIAGNGLSIKSKISDYRPQIRQASSSSLLYPITSLFSRQTSGASYPSSSRGREGFLKALASGRPDDLLRPYDEVIQSVQTGGQTSPQMLSGTELTSAMNLLLSSTSRKSVHLLRRMYADYSQVFGHTVRSRHHRILLQGLCASGNAQHAFAFAKALDGQAGLEEVMSAKEWRAVLKVAVTNESTLVDEIEEIIRAKGLLDSSCMALLLKNLRHRLPTDTVDRLSALLAEVERGVGDGNEKLTLRQQGTAELIRLYMALGDLKNARKESERFIQRQDSNSTPFNYHTVSEPTLWNALLELEIAEDGRNVQSVLSAMKKAGIPPHHIASSYYTMQKLNQQSPNRSGVGLTEVIAAIDYAEKDVGLEICVETWTDILNRLITEGYGSDSLDLAVQVYDEARSRDVIINVNLAKTMIKPLCHAEPPRLNEAMRVYGDLLSASDSHPNSRLHQPHAGIYHSLLLACARSPLPIMSTSTAIRLVTDMRHGGIQFSPFTFTSLVILLMRSASDHTAAFNVYAHFYALGGSDLDEKAYTAILTTFLGLQWDSSPFAPLNLFMEILKDMRKAGYNPGPKILSSLLHRYAARPVKIQQSMTEGRGRNTSPFDTALSYIRDVHTLMKIDPMIDVDIPLLNSLMDAYSRAGAYAEAFEVWDELVERRSREPAGTVVKSYGPSINIILDTCGHSNSQSRARKAWSWANRWKLVSSRSNWEAWVECLARLGEIREATEVVTTVMGKEGVPEPSIETAEIVLKFSWRNEKDVEWVREKVKERFPEWWNDLQKVARTKGGNDEGVMS